MDHAVAIEGVVGRARCRFSVVAGKMPSRSAGTSPVTVVRSSASPFGGLWSPRTGAVGVVVVFRKGRQVLADNRDPFHDRVALTSRN